MASTIITAAAATNAITNAITTATITIAISIMTLTTVITAAATIIIPINLFQSILVVALSIYWLQTTKVFFQSNIWDWI